MRMRDCVLCMYAQMTGYDATFAIIELINLLTGFFIIWFRFLASFDGTGIFVRCFTGNDTIFRIFFLRYVRHVLLPFF